MTILMNKKLSILGSTGSIGKQALEVAKKCGFEVTALTASSSSAELEKQIREFKPNIAALVDEKAAQDLAVRVSDTNTKVVGGIQGICECAVEKNADIVLNAIVGMAGLF